MAETKLRERAVIEKLNSMAVDLIDVEPTVDTSAYTVGDLLFNPIEIANAVAVTGGTAIIQSIAVANADALTGAFDIVFTQSDDGPGTLNNPIGGESGLSDTNADKVLGIVTISNMVDTGLNSVGGKTNIGMVIKAPDASRSIYAFGIAQSTDNPSTSTGYKIRIGLVKD
tara:strand:- start:233 stop:742 length:510 start_codon:yes stop_codon:yes gene_type:complete